MNFRERYGQWAIVLGATEGIGKAGAFEFALRGMDVILVGRRKEALEVLAKEIHDKTGREAKVIQQDLSEYDAAMYPEDVVREGFEQLGKKLTYLAGELNREKMKKNNELDRNELIEKLGRMFQHMA